MDDIEVVREALNRGEQLTSSGWWGDAQASLARIEAQLSALQTETEQAKMQDGQQRLVISDIEAQLSAVRPVVEAAMVVADENGSYIASDGEWSTKVGYGEVALRKAVVDYRAALKETTDG